MRPSGLVLPQQVLTRTYTHTGLGLKILVSAVQSRPSPPFISNSCPSRNFLRSEFVPKLCLTPAHSSALWRTRDDFTSAEIRLLPDRQWLNSWVFRGAPHDEASRVAVG